MNEKKYSIGTIKRWLNLKWEYYKKIKDNWNCNLCPTEKSLPCICDKPDKEYIFTLVYEKLDEIRRYHKNEEYFRKELLEYEEIKHSEVKLKIWTFKNEKFGIDDYLTFKEEYLGYEYDNRENTNLRVFGPNKLTLDIVPNIFRKQIGKVGKRKTDFEIYIHRNDFKYTLEFIEVFCELFWVRVLLPERIELIDKEFEEME
jgi:hypothetical protein